MSPRSRLDRWQAACVRWLGLLVLVFTTPIAQDVIVHVAPYLAHTDDDCHGDCDEPDCEERDCCPVRCVSCHRCPHANALAAIPFAMPRRTAPVELLGLFPAELRSSGYVSPPFRPPTG